MPHVSFRVGGGGGGEGGVVKFVVFCKIKKLGKKGEKTPHGLTYVSRKLLSR